MTGTRSLSPAGPVSTPTRQSRRTWPVLALLAVLLIATAAYGLAEHRRAEEVAEQRNALQASLTETRKDLHSVEDELFAKDSDLSEAQQQLTYCSDVSRVAMEMFQSTGSLLDAMTQYPYGEAAMDEAGENIRMIRELIHARGMKTIDELVAECSDQLYTSAT